ncbi:hypothetical protein CAOG_002283 [Capsaspora owczarzaki ATCC 30864]|uniref:Rho-GAP domain-containing protein n=1 Tax=Capsaspora owczarzaki (strain ATCC 30864) TaxID=595528 RepID=A0A0D2WL02_CAPO3|nr:hypothetical protein CAOG_002283 [Capsaspora owczarzaki ATCC 30864]
MMPDVASCKERCFVHCIFFSFSIDSSPLQLCIHSIFYSKQKTNNLFLCPHSARHLAAHSHSQVTDTTMEGFRRASRRFSQRSKPLFGVNYNDRVEALACEAMIFLEQEGLKEEGLFRVPGSVPTVQQMKKDINRGEREGFQREDSVHDVASLLKQLYRELAEPLMTFDLHDVFIAAQATSGDAKSRRERILATLDLMPEANLNGLKLLMQFLAKVARFSKFNKMEPSNLAIVFAPSLLRSKEESTQLITDSVVSTALLVNLIQDFNYFFAVKQEAKALYDYKAVDENEVSLTRGEKIFVLTPPDDEEPSDWIKVEVGSNNIGYVPTKFITFDLTTPMGEGEAPDTVYTEGIRLTAQKVKSLMEARYQEIYSNLERRDRTFSTLQVFRSQMEQKYSTFRKLSSKRLEEERVKFENTRVARFKQMMESRYGRPPGQSPETDAENQKISDDFKHILLDRMDRIKRGEFNFGDASVFNKMSEDELIDRSIMLATARPNHSRSASSVNSEDAAETSAV